MPVLCTQNATCAQDLLVVCGEDYLNLRRSFMQAFVDSSIESVRSAFQVCINIFVSIMNLLS